MLGRGAALLRPGYRTARLLWGRATRGFRALPDFVIVGAQKSGTSSLYAYLVQHPSVVGGLAKEVHFFDRHFDRGTSWYRSFFPFRRTLHRVSATTQSTAVTGEATPFYMFHPQGARRMATALPDARLILILREPASRAISHYHHARRLGHEHRDLETAVDEEPRLLAEEWERRGVAAYDDHTSATTRLSYVTRGHYAEQFQRILRWYERHNVLVLLSSELFSDPQAGVDRVCRFLRLRPYRLGDASPRNVGTYLSEDDRTVSMLMRLREHFEPHNRALRRMLGYELPW